MGSNRLGDLIEIVARAASPDAPLAERQAAFGGHVPTAETLLRHGGTGTIGTGVTTPPRSR